MIKQVTSNYRVKVKTSDGIPVSLERSMLMSSAILESLAVLVVQELNEIAGGLLAKEKTIKVCSHAC